MRTAVFTKIFADRPLEEAIDLAADLGYDGVELMGRAPHLAADTPLEHARELKDHLDDRGLGVPCIATNTGDYVGTTEAEDRAELADLERFLRLAGVFDCDVIRHGPGGPPPFEATEEVFEQAAAGMRLAADLAAEYGVTLCVEIHAKKVSETAESTLRLLDLIDRENVGVIHDAGNMFIVDTDYGPESIDALGDRLVHVHVKDESLEDDPSHPDAGTLDRPDGPRHYRPRLMDEGDVDYGSVIDGLASVGYDGFLTDECHVGRDDPDDDVRIAEHELAVLSDLLVDAGVR